MKGLLLSVHVVAGVLFVGPSAVAASLFPRYAPSGSSPAPAAAALLHRITRVYGLLALVVPVVGILLAIYQGRMTEVWVLVALVLTAAAGGILALQIYPRQGEALSADADPGGLRLLAALAGVFNLLWVVVVVLMIVRPGAAA